MKKIFLIFALSFLIPTSSNSFFGEKWQGWVYPDRTNLSNSISVGKDFKSLSDCRAACVNKINTSRYNNADYECGLDCKPLYPNIPDSVMVCKKTER
jgi:hypothetical protein